MKRTLRSALLLPILFCGGLAIAADHEHHGSMATSAPAASAGVVSLDVYAAGSRLHLLTAVGSPARLEYRRSDDGGRTWSAPVTVGDGQPAPSPIHRGMDAQVAAAPDGRHLVAAWTTAGAQDRFGRGPIATAVSSDGGATWAAGPNPADDGLSTGHAFLDLACDGKGSFHLVWLDGRSASTSAGEAAGTGMGGGKGLRYARSDDFGADWTRNKTLDPETCECCWNAIRTAPDGRVAVLYRDHGPRDMAVVTSADSGRSWAADPVAVGAFHWNVDACPHVGGGLAFGSGQAMFATVWTAAGENTGAYLLSSPDGGRSWSAPTRLGGDRRSWHTDVAADAGGRVAVVWDARTDSSPAVFAMTSRDGGQTWSAPRRLTPPDVTATHPRVAPAGDGFRAFWTQTAGDAPATWTSVPLPE